MPVLAYPLTACPFYLYFSYTWKCQKDLVTFPCEKTISSRLCWVGITAACGSFIVKKVDGGWWIVRGKNAVLSKLASNN